MNNVKMKTGYYYLIAFIEGSCVMAIELAAAKMIAPFYGTSLYVWAAVLAVTLGGLTTGYYLGGWATFKFSAQKLLFFILLGGSLLTAAMPMIAQHIMPAVSSLGLRTGSLVSCLGFMLLPLVCMGMVSPTLIQISNTELKGTGRTAGTIYAISTVGGILMTLLMGFYFLPEWGIRNSIILVAGLLGSMTIMLVILLRRYRIWLGAGLLLVAGFLVSATTFIRDPAMALRFIYRSEGILGQVSVLNYPLYEANQMIRLMFINQVPQTQENVEYMPVSMWTYPHRISAVSSLKPRGSKALLVGMAGGSLAMELKKMGFGLDVVEIDERMPFIAGKYFAFDARGINISIDDGRHFIRSAKGKYDLIIIDVLNGEVQPFHMFTMESFAEMKKILSDDALIIINLQGFIQGEHGRAARSIYKTLEESGFRVWYFSKLDEKAGDVHLYASMKGQDFTRIDSTKLNDCCRQKLRDRWTFVTDVPLDLSDAVILTDDRPMLEALNNYAAEYWRKLQIGGFLANLRHNRIPYFK
ncbi:MAG: fused MFS/spermidine synthase [Bacteroidetes bacterium]|nr:fused MFS/spermidine synthase [Bacteroidota bacterium]